MKKFQVVKLPLFVALSFFIGAEHLAASKCRDDRSIVEIYRFSKEKKLRYILAIVTVLPGKKNQKIVHFKRRNFLRGTNSEVVTRFTLNDLLLDSEEGGTIPEYTNYPFLESSEKKKILLEGFIREGKEFQYIEKVERCKKDLELLNGEIRGDISNRLASKKKQKMGVKDFKEFFKNLEKKIERKDAKKGKVSKKSKENKGKVEEYKIQNALRFLKELDSNE